MRVQNEELWAEQLAEFEADEMSRKFRDFLVLWVDTADDLLDTHQQTPIGSLKRAFEVAEQTFGYISVEWLGQMMLVIVQHWFHGTDVWESLSVWERRIVEQATAMKLVELQDQAEEESPAGTPSC